MHKRIKRLQRWLRNRKTAVAGALILIIISSLIFNTMQQRRLTVDPTSYKALLELIARAESSDNDNAYFGNASNQAVLFTTMSIADVLTWQADYVSQGSPSSAVGRYQLVNTTLAGLVQQLGVNTQHKFDRAMQDKLAIALIERRGSESYINSELTREQFAANLAKEWAGLPRVIGDTPGDSYYASDGLNRSRVSVEDVMQAIAPIQAQ